ncbi:hypothetical protein FQN50_006877 [Emmonsiellopsis sp. PD_5]|nr:hypothetical protein FQN50_006877 [Emmonsiellopsis sp. PD_5]
MALLLAILQSAAGVRFQHAMLAAKVAVAEAAVTDDALCEFLALLEAAAGLPGGCHFSLDVGGGVM